MGLGQSMPAKFFVTLPELYCFAAMTKSHIARIDSLAVLPSLNPTEREEKQIALIVSGDSTGRKAFHCSPARQRCWLSRTSS